MEQNVTKGGSTLRGSLFRLSYDLTPRMALSMARAVYEVSLNIKFRVHTVLSDG